MRIRTPLIALLLALAASACGPAAKPRLPAAQGAGQSSSATVPDGAAFVADNSLVVGSQTYRLAATAGAPLIGSLAPLAVASADGSRYVYNSWAQGADEVCSGDPSQRGNCTEPAADAIYGRPTLRVFTPADGKDVVVQVGAVSAALRADGALAYFKGVTNDAPADAARFSGHLYVRDSIGADPVQWTTAEARYVAVGWAGATLIAYRHFEAERFDVIGLSGPGAARTLAADATVVAISPDGAQLVVNRDADGTSTVSVIDASDGRQLSALNLATTTDPASGSAVGWATYGGSWDGDLVAAESTDGVSLFRVKSGKIAFDRMLLRKGSDYPMGIHEPHLFRGKSGRVDLVAWAPVNAPTEHGRAEAVITCDVAGKSCKRTGTRNERSVGIARSNGHGRAR